MNIGREYAFQFLVYRLALIPPCAVLYLVEI